METNAFAPLAVLQLPSACRLLASACSPDKDLVALISRLGGKDRLSLWKMQGSKKWDVDVSLEENTSSEGIVGLAWSPSGTEYMPTRLCVRLILRTQGRVSRWRMILHASHYILCKMDTKSEHSLYQCH